MSKPGTASADLDYFRVNCEVSGKVVSLGLVGSLRLDEESNLLLLISTIPAHIPGLDDIGMQMVAAVPEALYRDMKELSQKRMAPIAMLVEMARRQSGTVSASGIAKERIGVNLLVHAPGELFSQIVKAAVQLATSQHGPPRAITPANSLPVTSPRSHVRSRESEVPHPRFQNFESQMVVCSA